MKVTLTIRGTSMLVDPWVPSVLQSPLTAIKRVRKERPRRGESPFKVERMKLYEELETGAAYTHAGLVRYTTEALRAARIEYEILDKRGPLPEFDLSDVGELRKYQPDVLAAICCSRFGIIDCPTGMGKTFIVEQICKIYKNLKILVVSGSRSVVNSVYDRICNACPDRKISKHSGSHKFKPESEIVVSTVRVLYKMPSDWPDLLIYDEVHEAGSPTAMQGVMNFPYCRRFGLSASPEGRSDLADKLIEALFGPKLVQVTYQDAQKAGIVSPIQCRFIPVLQNIGHYESEIDRKRHGYWRHPKRNELISKAANKFEDQQVLVFVEKTEHALRLKKLLPEFTVVHGGVSEEQWNAFIRMQVVRGDEEDLKSPKSDDIRKRFESGELQKVICTTTWNKGVDFPNLSVLIRGDGQTSSIPCTQIVGRLARISEGKSHGILIDFNDDFDPWFKARSNKRRREYQDKGWTCHEWNP